VPVKLVTRLPRLRPPAAYFTADFDVAHPPGGFISTSLDAALGSVTANWFATRGVALTRMVPTRIVRVPTVDPRRRVAYVLAMRTHPPAADLYAYSVWCGLGGGGGGTVSNLTTAVRLAGGAVDLGRTVTLTAPTSIAAAAMLQRGGIMDEETGVWAPARPRAAREGLAARPLALIVGGTVGGLLVVAAGLMLYFRLRGQAAARYRLFQWPRPLDGGTDLGGASSMRSAMSSFAGTLGVGGGGGGGARGSGGGGGGGGWSHRRQDPPSFSSEEGPPERPRSKGRLSWLDDEDAGDAGGADGDAGSDDGATGGADGDDAGGWAAADVKARWGADASRAGAWPLDGPGGRLSSLALSPHDASGEGPMSAVTPPPAVLRAAPSRGEADAEPTTLTKAASSWT